MAELNKQYKRAREIGYTLMADDIIEISDTPVLTERGDATDRSRLRVESRKWLLSKALPKVYGDKQTIEGKFTVDWAQVPQEAADKWKKKTERCASRLRTIALNILRANGVKNVGQALFRNALNLENILSYNLS